jgi:DNA invertase Pin-like site-specific DNA recombinase
MLGKKHEACFARSNRMVAGFGLFVSTLIREREREGIAFAKGKGVYKRRKPTLTSEAISSPDRERSSRSISLVQV